MPTVPLKQLQAGDVLLCYGWNGVAVAQGALKSLNRATAGAVKTAREVATAPFNAVYHAARSGSAPRVPVIFDLNDPVGIGKGTAKANHAIIVSDRTEIRSLTPPRVDLRYSHAVNQGCYSGDLEVYLANHTGNIAVFRLKDGADTAGLGTAAARVAATWANENAPFNDAQVGASYSMWKAVSSAFSSHSFGPGARRRAAHYRAHRGTVGGPTSTTQFSRGKDKKKEWFCSMFVIACYQAAMADDAVASRVLALDARNTTPMTLDGYLKGSQRWKLLGYASI